MLQRSFYRGHARQLSSELRHIESRHPPTFYSLFSPAVQLTFFHRKFSEVPINSRCLQACCIIPKSVDKSLARPGRKQATATEDFDVHIAYL
jgi:hypothetical protein